MVLTRHHTWGRKRAQNSFFSPGRSPVFMRDVNRYPMWRGGTKHGDVQGVMIAAGVLLGVVAIGAIAYGAAKAASSSK